MVEPRDAEAIDATSLPDLDGPDAAPAPDHEPVIGAEALPDDVYDGDASLGDTTEA